MTKRSRIRRLAVLAAVCALASPLRAHAALFLDGPATVVPGQTFPLSLGLDAALVAEIDELTLLVQFDPGVLTGQNAVAGALLGSGSFAANAAAGTATHSFPATLSDLGPGVLATWTFAVDPAAIPQTATLVQATLQTFVTPDDPTALLSAGPLTITVIPEPSSVGLLLAGLALLGGLHALRRH